MWLRSCRPAKGLARRRIKMTFAHESGFEQRRPRGGQISPEQLAEIPVRILALDRGKSMPRARLDGVPGSPKDKLLFFQIGAPIVPPNWPSEMRSDGRAKRDGLPHSRPATEQSRTHESIGARLDVVARLRLPRDELGGPPLIHPGIPDASRGKENVESRDLRLLSTPSR